jgi:hypothetical protein
LAIIFSLLQPSAYPESNTELNWELLISQDYIENQGKLRMGRKSITFHQLYSSQATTSNQELLFKVAVGLPQMGRNYKVDFKHRLSAKETVNRLEVALHNWVQFEAYMTDKKDISSHRLRSGITYPGVDLAAGVDLVKGAKESLGGEAFIRWGPEGDVATQMTAELDLKQGQQANVDYVVDTTLTLPNMAPIKMSGTILLDQQVATLSLNCKQGPTKYNVDFSIASKGSGFELEGSLTANTLNYKLGIVTRNDNVKSVHIDLLLEKHYVLNAIVSTTYYLVISNIF